MGHIKQYATWLESNCWDSTEAGFSKIWDFFSDDLDLRINTAKHRIHSNDIFLSYSTDDAKLAENLACGLNKKGARVWFDRWIPQEHTSHGIPPALYPYLHNGISSSRTGISLVSESFLKKEWAPHETRGLYRNNRLEILILHQVKKEQALDLLDIDEADVCLMALSVECLSDTVDKIASTLGFLSHTNNHR